MRLGLVSLVIVLASAVPARAALDPELKKPYKLEVVLQVAENRALTPLFQDELERSLSDLLRQSFGALAEINVQRRHPLLGEIAARGLEAALEGWEAVDTKQTHFVLLDYSGGRYRLQARVHDGMTGQAGAVVHRLETGDRGLVPVLAARLVENEFAPVGTVTAVKSAGTNVEVELTLKGGGLGVPLSRWIKTGQVFAVSRIVAQGPRERPARIAWALFEVREPPRAGVCRCRYWRRFLGDDLRAQPGVLGYRAVKLETTDAPVRLRVLEEETYQPIDGTQVRIIQHEAKQKTELTTNRDGLAVTRDAFTHFVLVELPREGVRFPLELVEGRTAVCRVKVKGGSEALAALEYRRDAWIRRVYDDASLVAVKVKELGKAVSQSLPAAEKMAREGLASLDTELKDLALEHSELKRLAQEHKLPAARFDLSDGAQRLDELRRRRDKLSSFIDRVAQAIKEGEENAVLSQQLERARLLEAEAEYEPAIAIYEKVLAARPGQTKVREHLDDLKRGWAIKDEKHKAARAFAYETWAGKLDVAGLKKNLEPARQALATLRATGDRLTAEKMRLADLAHTANLKNEDDRLKRNDTPDNRNRAKALAEVAAGLGQLHAELTAFLAARKE